MVTFLEDYGISPTVGVILMVAITVILAVTVGYTVLGIGNDTSQNANAGISLQETPDGIQVGVQDIGGGTETLRLIADGTVVTDSLSVGDTVTVTAPEGATVSVVGVSKDGSENVIRSITTTKDTGSVGVVGGGGAPSISDPSSTAPSNVTAVLEDMDGSGTSSDPYQITNDQELQAINADLDANYELVNDIDASKTGQWNGGSGFKTIGGYSPTVTSISSSYAAGVSGVGPASQADSSQDKFTGTLNGNGYEVSGLTMNRGSESWVGFIDYLGAGGVVKNIGFVNADIAGQDTAGIIAGESAGEVVNSYSTGTVGIQSDEYMVGGLVGSNQGSITQSYSTASITDGSIAGGVAGASSGTIMESYAEASVSGVERVGGLAGVNSGTLESSYSLSSVAGERYVGGAVGKNTATVRNVYAAGSVNASVGGSGGLVAQIDSGGFMTDPSGETIESYWDTEVTNQSDSVGSAVGLQTSELTGSSASSNMPEFDFAGTWTTTDSGYPILQWQSTDS